MKTMVFIFVPVGIDRAENHVAVQSAQSDEQIVANNDATRREVYPFWTWFIDNPHPQSRK